MRIWLDNALDQMGRSKGTKTGSTRVVLLQARAQVMLADWRELTKRKEPEDFIISLRQSVPHDRAWLARTLAGRNLVVHSFRHTCVSLMRNVAPDEIETAMSGNASKKALDIYTHRNSADLLARLEPARDRVEAFWKAEDNTGNPRAGDGRK